MAAEKTGSTIASPDWIIEQALEGLMQLAEASLKRAESSTTTAVDPHDEFVRLGLDGESQLTPFRAFSAEYLAAYRGSTNAKVVAKKQLGWLESRLTKRRTSAAGRADLDSFGIRVASWPGSSRAVLSSWNPVALDSVAALPGESVAWFRLQWTQSLLFKVAETMELLKATGAQPMDVRVVDQQGLPIADALVALVYSQVNGYGTEMRTDASGMAFMVVPKGLEKLDAIAVVPRHGHWSHAQLGFNVPSVNTHTVVLEAIGQAHGSQFKYLAPANPSSGQGVRCAVIDSGIGPHPALKVVAGANCIADEDEHPDDVSSFEDNGTGHGTHVAGIIAARAIDGDEPIGIAPAVDLFSYRVTSRLSREAPSYAIADAIDQAIDRGCHLINVSLGLESRSVDVDAAVERAYQAGAVVIAAVGNAPGEPVMYPAASPRSIAVAALGDKSRLASNSMSAFTVRQPPTGDHPHDFVANFNCTGPELAVAAPGVGIISCAPGGHYYAVQDGTSMATPVVTGCAARVLATRADIINMTGTVRADAIRQMILEMCDQLGFHTQDVGKGHPIS